MVDPFLKKSGYLLGISPISPFFNGSLQGFNSALGPPLGFLKKYAKNSLPAPTTKKDGDITPLQNLSFIDQSLWGLRNGIGVRVGSEKDRIGCIIPFTRNCLRACEWYCHRISGDAKTPKLFERPSKIQSPSKTPIALRIETSCNLP